MWTLARTNSCEVMGVDEMKVSSPPMETWYIYILMGLIGFMMADLAVLKMRAEMIPTKAAPIKARSQPRKSTKGLSEYNHIARRNILNSDGRVPDPIQTQAKDEKNKDDTGVPVASQLPLELVGTMVHANPAKSLATINLKGRNRILPFVPGDDMEGMGTLVRVERLKAIFRNSNNGRLEYIEIKTDQKINFGSTGRSVVKSESKEINRAGNHFKLKRSVLDKYLNNLDDILTKARAVPYSPPGSGGKIEGFRLLSISPGSIFETLGLERMDIIKSVNGQPVNSPSKAMELYNALKTSDHIALGLERNGQFKTFNYEVE